MLTIKANSKNINIKYREIPTPTIDRVSIVQSDGMITYVFKCNNHGISNGSTIIFDRNDGNILYKDRYTCSVANNNEFSITTNIKYQLYPSYSGERNIVKPVFGDDVIPSTGKTENYGYFEFTDNKHIFEINRGDIKIDDYYVWTETPEDKYYKCIFSDGSVINYKTNEKVFSVNKNYSEYPRYCVGDEIMLTTGVVVLESCELKTISAEKKYVHVNRKDRCDTDYLLFENTYLVQSAETLNITGKTITAETIDSTAIINLNVLLIPIRIDGRDNTNEILFENNSNFSGVSSNLFGYNYYCEDTRFFTRDGSNYVINDGVKIYEENGNVKVTFCISDNSNIDTFKDDFYRNNYIQNEINKGINPIVNYERYPYEPMYYDGLIGQFVTDKCKWLKNNPSSADTHCKDVNKIVFDLNFRRKKFVEYKNTETNKVIYRDFGPWETDDRECWNNYILNDDGTKLVYRSSNITGNTSDLLGWLGFTDDDVYYQKSALKKSFLRLSFYDSTDRRTQKLLFYSTVYLDSNSKFGTYIKALKYSNSGNTDPAGIVYSDAITSTTGEHIQLNASLFCTNKYDESTSSDGFYIHLFDKTTNGNQFSEIYMKAEFNNAKTGKIIPLICPMNENGKPIKATSLLFPFNYLNKYNETISGQTLSGVSGVNMEKLASDMYIKILVKYNYEKNKYMWMLPTDRGDYNNETMTFTLFEPRLYGFDKDYKD